MIKNARDQGPGRNNQGPNKALLTETGKTLLSEALLLHPNLSQLPSFTAWPRCAEMLEEGRRPGVCAWDTTPCIAVSNPS